MTVVIPLFWKAPPVTQNDRQHHHVKARAVARALAEARLAIRAARVTPILGANVTLHYRVPDLRRRDADNLAVTLKVAQDALVAEGILPRDDWVHIPRSSQQIHPPSDEGPALWLELEVLTEYDGGAA